MCWPPEQGTGLLEPAGEMFVPQKTSARPVLRLQAVPMPRLRVAPVPLNSAIVAPRARLGAASLVCDTQDPAET